jgi:NAD-dependent SIR2 family protein deacetylase
MHTTQVVILGLAALLLPPSHRVVVVGAGVSLPRGQLDRGSTSGTTSTTTTDSVIASAASRARFLSSDGQYHLYYKSRAYKNGHVGSRSTEGLSS